MKAILFDPGIPDRLAPTPRRLNYRDRAKCAAAVRKLLALVPPERESCGITVGEAVLRDRYDAALKEALQQATEGGWRPHLLARLAAELPE